MSMVRSKVLIYDVRRKELREEEIDVTPKEESMPTKIDFSELAKVIEDVKRIKEKLGLA